MMVSAANDKIAAGKVEEGEEMLRQSIASCVVVLFITSIKRLWKEHQPESASLFVLAARQIKALPSGSEFHSLNFGFGPYLLKTADQSQEVDSQRMGLVDAYLDAASALIQSQDNEQVGQSTYILDNIKSALPLYARFRSASSPEVVLWINEVTNRLPADKRNATTKVSTGPESPEDQIARFESIASKSDDPKIKDQAYASMVSTAISFGNFQQAADWVARILDVGLRREMQDDLIARQTQFALAKGSDSNEIVERIAGVAATPLRVKLYTQVAKGLCKKDATIANYALQEGLSITLKMDASPLQSQLLLSIADAYSEFDSTRAFEVLRDASKSIGKHKDQPPSRLGRGTLDLITVKYDPTFTFRRTMFEDPDQYKKPYDLSVFRKLARVDFDGSLLIASQVEDKLLQASAKYEICAGILLAGKSSDSSIPPAR